jgi:hypothetical protein
VYFSERTIQSYALDCVPYWHASICEYYFADMCDCVCEPCVTVCMSQLSHPPMGGTLSRVPFCMPSAVQLSLCIFNVAKHMSQPSDAPMGGTFEPYAICMPSAGMLPPIIPLPAGPCCWGPAQSRHATRKRVNHKLTLEANACAPTNYTRGRRNRMYAPYMTVYLVIFLPKTLHITVYIGSGQPYMCRLQIPSTFLCLACAFLCVYK